MTDPLSLSIADQIDSCRADVAQFRVELPEALDRPLRKFIALHRKNMCVWPRGDGPVRTGGQDRDLPIGGNVDARYIAPFMDRDQPVFSAADPNQLFTPRIAVSWAPQVEFVVRAPLTIERTVGLLPTPSTARCISGHRLGGGLEQAHLLVVGVDMLVAVCVVCVNCHRRHATHDAPPWALLSEPISAQAARAQGLWVLGELSPGVEFARNSWAGS